MSLLIPGTVLITGTSGQVGSALWRLMSAAAPEVEGAAPSRTQLDLGDPAGIRDYVKRIQPRWIVSSAAYTAVDAAETDRDAAFAANGEAPGVLAEAAASIGAGIIHLSTDYVFDGSGDRPWVETDATGPKNVYGASKLAGEQAIAAAGAPHAILRTSWVYSGGGKNFVRTMLRLLSTRTEALRIVGDQHGAPTAAADLADAIFAIITAVETRAHETSSTIADALGSRSGVYHCAGTGETTWAGLAEAVRGYLEEEQGQQPPSIIPVPSTEYPTPAPRPLNSRLNCDKLARDFGIRLPDWQTSVGVALRELALTDMPAVTASR